MGVLFTVSVLSGSWATQVGCRLTCARSSRSAHWLQVARQFRSHGQLTSLACTGAVKCLRLGQLDKTASAWQAHAPAPGIRPAGSTVTNSCAPVQGTRVGQSGGYWRSSQEQLAAPGYLKRAKQGGKGETEKTGDGLLKFCFEEWCPFV